MTKLIMIATTSMTLVTPLINPKKNMMIKPSTPAMIANTGEASPAMMTTPKTDDTKYYAVLLADDVS